MIFDLQNQFSSSQAVTAAAASTNLLDLGIARDLGTGENLYIVLVVTVALTDAGSDSTVTVDAQTDDNDAFSSPATAQTLFTVPALSAIGAQFIARLQPGAINERYLRLFYTPNNGNLTTGSFISFVVHDIQKYVSYAKGYTIS